MLTCVSRVTNISAGLEHLVILTNKGRVFTSSAANTFPTRGQLGVPGLTWETRRKDLPYEAPNLIFDSNGPKITQIATGDYHSVILDTEGRPWVFGDNGYGQLGFPWHPELSGRDIPTELSVLGLYPGTGYAVKCKKIAAGGLNSYFMVDALEEKTGKTIADVWASGQGLWGALGNGKWTHFQGEPVKVKNLSGLMECKSFSPLCVSSRYQNPQA